MHPNWLLRSRLGPPTRCVYVGLLSHLPYGDQDGVVWPAVETIAFEGGVCERAAYNALYELRDRPA